MNNRITLSHDDMMLIVSALAAYPGVVKKMHHNDDSMGDITRATNQCVEIGMKIIDMMDAIEQQ